MRIPARETARLARRAREGRVVAFDTETTGCGMWDEICQIAAAEFVGGRLGRTMSLYVRPSRRVSRGAFLVHGLSDAFLRENGLEPEAAMERFFRFVGDDALLVAHNAPFDLRMLRQECRTFGLFAGWRGVDTCCTLAMSRRLRPDLPHHSLGYLVQAMEIDGVNTHDALDDAMACAGVFFRLLEGWERGEGGERGVRRTGLRG